MPRSCASRSSRSPARAARSAASSIVGRSCRAGPRLAAPAHWHDYGVESWRWALTDDVTFRLRVRLKDAAP